MKNAFPGIPKEGIGFLRDLAKNNNREWFAPRKEIHEEKVRQPVLALVEAVHREMARFAPDYVGDPAKCVYRIYRDTRFSKDKTPYKTHAGALMWRNGTSKNEGAAFYFGISPKSVEVAAGIYAPDPATLLLLRNHIAISHAAFRATFEKPRVKKLMGELHGESLSRAPKGFDPEHPAADLLRRKRLVLYTELDPKLATTPAVVKEIVTRFEALTPFVEYLNGPVLRHLAKRRRDEAFFD